MVNEPSRPSCGLVGVLGAMLLAAAPAVARAQAAPPTELPAEAVAQIAVVLSEKAQRTPAQQKISSRLLREQRIRRGAGTVADFSLRRTIDVPADGLVTVDIVADATPELLARIGGSGGTVLSAVAEHRLVRARLPLDVVEAIAEMPEVTSIRPADVMTTSQRIAVPTRYSSSDVVVLKVDTSEGDVAHRATAARSLYGVTGAGIGIGVLSDGVNTLAARQASGDLPAVTVLPGQAGSGDEGTAMLEIVHDLAPGASLYFATALGGQAQFAANIEALCAAGARVIVDDVFYFAESVFQDGIVAQGVNDAVGAGCIYFSSAGNSGNRNDGTSGVWEGDFVAAGSTPGGVSGTAHDFGGANSNAITLDSPSLFTLQWSDPRGGSANDYDLFLFNPTLTTLFEASTDTQNGTQDPFEAIDSSGFVDTGNRLVVVRFSGAARYLHLNANRGRLGTNTAGQTAGHAAAKNAVGVAAVNAGTAVGGRFTGGPSNPVATYSSDGPRRIFYHPDGTPITPGNVSSSGGEVVLKPDIAAADCVSTATPGFRPFCGTSAAAPHAAAIAALMLEASPPQTRSTLVAAMAARALDIEAAGPDVDSGAGIVDALGAVGRTHPAFVDASLTVGSSFIRAVHVSQLRSRVNALRLRCGLAEFAFTDPVLTTGSTFVRAVHVAELRTALDAAYAACGLASPEYATDPTLPIGVITIKAAHINELRAAIVGLE